MEILAIFGARICARRKSIGLTQELLAERASLSVLYVRQIEKGRANPTLKTLARLAQALHTTTEEMLSAHSVRYSIIIDEVDGIETFGIECTDGQRVPDISPKRDLVQNLVNDLNEYGLDPIQLNDVIYDRMS